MTMVGSNTMYGKHFSSMYCGSMVGAGLNVFAVWGYVVANQRCGQVELNPRLLAMQLGGSEAEIVDAIGYLCAPDPHSRSKREDGKRLIREGEFAYRVVNHDIYSGMLNEMERREYNRRKQAEHRSRKRNGQTVSSGVNETLPRVSNEDVYREEESLSLPSGEVSPKELIGSGGMGESASASEATRPKASRKRPAREMPDDWAPNRAHNDIALNNGLNVRTEEAKFRDNAEAKGLRYSNWDAAFRTWLRRAPEFQRSNGKPPGRVEHEMNIPADPKTEAILERARRYAEAKRNVG